MEPDLRDIFQHAVHAVMPHNVIAADVKRDQNHLIIQDHCYDLNTFSHCYVCGSGKAAGAMAESIESLLEDLISGGIIVSPDSNANFKRLMHKQSTHPLPSLQSVEAAEAMIHQFEKATRRDLIIYLLSGGTSALIEKPISTLTLDDFIATTQLLLANGLSIDEVNAVRKHLSLIKGGRLAQATEATVIVLVISDVIGDDLHTIGSAPLYCDTKTYFDVRRLLKESNLIDKLRPSVLHIIESGCDGTIKETPKSPKSNVTHILLSGNTQALESAQSYAQAQSIRTVLDKTPLSGDVSEGVASFLQTFESLPDDTLLLRGGECTVTVRGEGKGGRNQHFALLCLDQLRNRFNYTLIAAGTDGIDGNSDAAGAIISNALFDRATAHGVQIEDAIRQFDSGGFFDSLGASILTGYTRTNVMDVVIAYKGKA